LIGSFVKRVGGPSDKSWVAVMRSFEELAMDTLPGDWGAVLLFVGTDLEYSSNELGLAHFNGAKPCMFCEADCTALFPFADLSPGAAWRPTVRNNDEFLASIRRPLHPLTAHPIFSMYTYRLDLLHNIDHHGVAGHIEGNVFAMHLNRQNDILPGANEELRLDYLNEDKRHFYMHTGVQNRMPPLKITQIVDGDFPELHGPCIKAANCRALLPYAVDLQRRAVERDATPINKHAFKAAESLQAAIEVMYTAGYFLTPAELASLDKHLTRPNG